MKTTTRYVTALLLFFIVGVYRVGRDTHPKPNMEAQVDAATASPAVTSSTDGPLSAQEAASVVSGGYFEAGVVSWREDEFVQSYTATLLGRTFYIQDQEYDSATGTWSSTYYSGSIPFFPSDVSHRKRDWFYLVGEDDNGDVVIQQWRLKVPNVSGPGGFGGSSTAKTIKRTEIFRGQLESPVVAIEIDPEKRFLLVLAGDLGSRRIYTFPVQPGASPSILVDYIQMPEIANASRMKRLQHLTLGRVWLIEDDDFSGYQVILIDADNDGIFEGTPIIGTHLGNQNSGILDHSYWLDTFTGVW